MKKILFCIFFIPTFLLSQITVDKVGDDWDNNVYVALHLVYGISQPYYQNIVDNVKKVEFWNESYSSNDGKDVIVISIRDMKLGSIANIAAVLVHESCHLMLSKSGVQMDPKDEESECYSYELKFLQMLPNVEPELITHCKQQITHNKK
jgi:c-di-GMP-binding flagellar brake protein YcgR